jgi:hypothetical protein
MMNNLRNFCMVLVLALLVLPAFAMAADSISAIAAGNTVFLGEQGLDITAAMGGDTKLGWWASGASVSASAPDNSFSISSPTNFFISPAQFSSYLGTWYHLDSSGNVNGVAFNVADPNLDIRVEDITVNVDVTDKWVPTDDEIQFRIDTNLYQIAQRPGVSATPITIYVQSPDGGTFSSLINKAGTTTSTVDIPVSSTPYSTGPIWDTGRRDTYPPGTYKIWAECNVNSMKDNYDYSGKTYTNPSGLLDQERNPLIGVNTRTATPAIKATTAVLTTLSTVKTTGASPVPTSMTTPPTAPPTSSPTVLATAVKTKSPGFETVPAAVALFIALAWSLRKD